MDAIVSGGAALENFPLENPKKLTAFGLEELFSSCGFVSVFCSGGK
jgi:hypothetical protein